MTTNEFRSRLRQMDANERKRCWKHIGAPTDWGDERVIEMFMKEPAWNRTICDFFRVPTEEEKVGQANIESAAYAKQGFKIGVLALAIAVVSAVLSLVALFR